MKYMLWSVIVLLIIAWMVGFLVFKMVSVFIHLLLVLAVVLLVYNWFKKATGAS
jgi:uncharacterized membrane protein YoaK (UPF0700 family)